MAAGLTRQDETAAELTHPGEMAAEAALKAQTTV
jgi:hypothetical protein